MRFSFRRSAFSSSLGHAIECKVCEKQDVSCIYSQDLIGHQCPNASDHCYIWFSRRGIFIYLFLFYFTLIVHVRKSYYSST